MKSDLVRKETENRPLQCFVSQRTIKAEEKENFPPSQNRLKFIFADVQSVIRKHSVVSSIIYFPSL